MKETSNLFLMPIFTESSNIIDNFNFGTNLVDLENTESKWANLELVT